MIERLNTRNKTDLHWLVEFLNENNNYDFYLTKDNSRLYIRDIQTLKLLFRESIDVYYQKEKGMFVGIILLWRSAGGGKSRFFVKVVANNKHIARDLLTVLLWNTTMELYVKIRKDSEFLQVFKSKGFKFKGGRGVQILLQRKLRPSEAKIKSKEDYNNE